VSFIACTGVLAVALATMWAVEVIWPSNFPTLWGGKNNDTSS
jgi:hypothetical protein